MLLFPARGHSRAPDQCGAPALRPMPGATSRPVGRSGRGAARPRRRQGRALSSYSGASFSFFSGRTFTFTLAGLAANHCSAPVKGFLPMRALTHQYAQPATDAVSD